MKEQKQRRQKNRYYCPLCEHDVQWRKESQDEKEPFIKRMSENKFTQKSWKMKMNQTVNMWTKRDAHFIAVSLVYTVNVLKFGLINGDHT